MIDFDKLKEDFLAAYGDTICEEARVEIEQSINIKEAFAVLHKYLVYLRDRQIPDVGWLRKWFSEDKKTLNECGMLLDQTTIVHNPAYHLQNRPNQRSIICYGDSSVTFVLDDTAFYHITTQDHAVARVIARGYSICHIIAKGRSSGELLLKDETAKVKIKEV